jgi:signal transduction histidine kinase
MSRLRDLPARAEPADALIAAALAIPSVVQVLVAPIAPRAIGVPVALLATLPIAFRRRHAALAALVGSASWWLETDGYLVLGYVAAALLFYSLGTHEPDRRRLLGVCAFALLTGLVGTTRSHPVVYEYIAAVAIVIGPALVGRIVRRQQEQAERLRELTRHLERERERSAHAAVVDERARIARELHDVVAHSVSVMVVQASGVRRLLKDEQHREREALMSVEQIGRQALTEMRRMLGVMRSGEEAPAALAPQPGLQHLDRLIAQVEEAGLPVTLRVEGDRPDISPGVDLSAYRIVQEGLTNALKHAKGAHAEVVVRYIDSSVELEISDNGNGGPAGDGMGHGLVGMRERVALYGGTIESGPRADGGFVLRAQLPVEGHK